MVLSQTNASAFSSIDSQARLTVDATSGLIADQYGYEQASGDERLVDTRERKRRGMSLYFLRGVQVPDIGNHIRIGGVDQPLRRPIAVKTRIAQAL